MRYRVDSMSLRDGVLMLEGWAIPSQSERVIYEVTDRQGRPMKYTYVARDRADVAQQFGADRMSGFTVAVPFEREQDAYLVMRDGKLIRKVRVNADIVAKRNSVKAKRMEKLLALCHFETLQVCFDFYKENGLRALVKKAAHKLQKIDEDYDYPEWQFKTKLSEAELDAQREAWKQFHFAGFAERETPLISIVIPAYNTPERYLCMLFDSLKLQTYPRFEVVVADGSEPGEETVKRVTEHYRGEDARFCYVGLGGNRGISENTNAGLAAAKGDFIALCDHDDELPQNALFEVAKAISLHPEAQFIYTDEDKVDFDGKALFEPHFKSDYNMDMLTSVNYICHLSVIRRDLLEQVGGFREAYDGAQDHDFFLRCLETATAEEQEQLKRYRQAVARLGIDAVADDSAPAGQAPLGEAAGGVLTHLSAETGLSLQSLRELAEGRFTSARVIHVPVICYHWRCHKGSTAADPKAKLYAFDAGSRAVKAHYERQGIAAGEVVTGVTYGYYHTKFTDEAGEMISALKTEDGQPPLVSVIIPNKDHVEDLDKCLRSLICRSNYRRLECIIVENNSTEEETFAYYQKIDGNPSYYLKESEKTVAAANVPGVSASGARTPASQADTQAGVQMGELAASQERSTANAAGSPQAAGAARRSADGCSIKVVYWKKAFNYSAINNFGVSFATGQYLLFLNNDVELIHPDSITEMVAYARRPEVGIVGARLLYGDHTIQHAGVIVGLGGIAGACFVGLHEKENSYMHRMMCVQDYSAVTAACLMATREAYDLSGGFAEDLAVAFNDIDFCMKVRKLGLLCVYNPYVSFFHYESKSRGLEDTPEKVRRFNGEIATFASRWGAILEAGDPYYNPNLTLRKANFALRDLTKEKPGEPYRLELDVDKQLKTVLKERERREKLAGLH